VFFLHTSLGICAGGEGVTKSAVVIRISQLTLHLQLSTGTELGNKVCSFHILFREYMQEEKVSQSRQ
jgi:hypothetical protein